MKTIWIINADSRHFSWLCTGATAASCRKAFHEGLLRHAETYEVDPEWIVEIVEMVADYPPQEYAVDTCYRDGCRL